MNRLSRTILWPLGFGLLLGSCSAGTPDAAAPDDGAISQPVATEVAPASEGQPPIEAGDPVGQSTGNEPADDDDSASNQQKDTPGEDPEGVATSGNAQLESGADTEADPPTPPPPGKGSATVELACTDRLDNDGDGAMDCDDTDCWSTDECEKAGNAGTVRGGDTDMPGEFGPDQGPFGSGPPGGEGPPKSGWTTPHKNGGTGHPDDGVGVACKDYSDCVCEIAKRSGGQEVSGYKHDDTCREARTYRGEGMEETCGHEMNNFKKALQDAREIYKALGIKIPAVCQ